MSTRLNTVFENNGLFWSKDEDEQKKAPKGFEKFLLLKNGRSFLIDKYNALSHGLNSAAWTSPPLNPHKSSFSLLFAYAELNIDIDDPLLIRLNGTA
mgnify:CR=1 FL=1